jgi:polysaccharide export outer membrane protein
VQVTVFGHPESSTPVEGALLDPDGRLDLPLAGPLALGGLTLEEARAAVRADLARFLRDPQVSIGLLESASRRFYLFGEVEECGAHPLDRPLTALQALSLGGGFLPGADREQVCLLRGEKDALEVYFFNGATPGPDGLVAVQPDDLIFVRLSGAGTFRDQVFPIVQSLVPPLAALASLVLIVDKLDE